MIKRMKLGLLALASLLLLGGSLAWVQQPGAPASLNEPWKSKEIDPLVDRLETESREIYRERALIAAIVGPTEGAVVADVGAGSGFMVEEFSRLVGPAGKVYAVDINPVMLQRIADRAREQGAGNIETITCPEDSTNLPANSVDIVFVCDTYHHFEYPAASMASIRQALRPGGQLLLVDFDRQPGETDEWMLEHVRGGREVFQKEIEEAGFELVNVHDLPQLEENYILRFRVKK